MSTVTSISSSASTSYATQLASSFALKRSLNNLDTAVQNGDLTSARSTLTALMKANPQFALLASDGSASQDPINQGFQALGDAIANNQTDAAQSAWTQIKGDMAKNGVTDLSDGTAATAKLLTDNRDSVAQQILTDTFGVSAGDNLLSSLLGSSAAASNETGLSSSLLSNWLTYQAGGNTASAVAASAGTQLDTAA